MTGSATHTDPVATNDSMQRDGGVVRCPVPPSVALATGCLLRIVFLSARPLNVDEAWTMLVSLSDQSLVDATSFATLADPHPLGFYALYRCLAPWIATSEWLFRLPVCIGSLLALFAFRAFLQTSAWTSNMKDWSLLLFAVLPVNVYYAYDARAYSIAQLATVLALLMYRRWQPPYHWQGGAGLACSVGLSCTFDVIGWVVVGAILLHQAVEFVRISAGFRPVAEDANTFVNRETSRNVWRVPLQKSCSNWKPLAATLIGVFLASGYFWMRYCQFAAAGGSDQSSKPVTVSVLLDGLMQLSPFGIGQDHGAHLPYGAFIYAAFCCVALCVLTRAVFTAIRNRDSTFILLWILCLLPFAGQLGLAVIDGGFRLHRRYLIVLTPGLVPIFCCGALGLWEDLTRWIGQGRGVPNHGTRDWKSSFGSLGPMLVLAVIPTFVSVAMNFQLGNRSDFRDLYSQIQSEIEPGDAFLYPYASPAPGFVIGPLLAYGHMQGEALMTHAILDPRIARGLQNQAIKLDDLTQWATPGDRAKTVHFVQQRASQRIWSFRSHVTDNCYIDLEDDGQPMGVWKAPAVEARLYLIRNPD